MDKQCMDQAIQLTIPADMEHVLVARMALSGFGMLAGLEVDLIDDLRTSTDECCDCLLHQGIVVKEVQICAGVREGRLYCRFCAMRGDQYREESVQDKDITLGILETLLPDVHLHCDEDGVCCIEFSMPV